MPRLPYIIPLLVSDAKASVYLRIPRKRALDCPAVAAEPLAGICAHAGDATLDSAPGEHTAAPTIVVGLVCTQPLGTPSGPALRPFDETDGIEQFLEDRRVAAIGRCMEEGEWNAVAVGDQMSLHTRPSAVYRTWADAGSPLW